MYPCIVGSVTEAIAWTPKAREVLAAASELFYARGIHAVGVDAIAEHSGITKRTLYQRFGSKERLVAEYLLARDEAWRALLAERLDAAGPDARDRIGAVFAASADWARDRGDRGCAMVNARAEISDPQHPASAVITGHKQWMREQFSALAAAAGARDPQRLGDRLLLLHEGALVTDGLGTTNDAFATAREAALALLPPAAG